MKGICVHMLKISTPSIRPSDSEVIIVYERSAPTLLPRFPSIFHLIYQKMVWLSFCCDVISCRHKQPLLMLVNFK